MGHLQHTNTAIEIINMARGLQNNNPLNIEKGIGFYGEVPSDDPRFAKFKSMEWGYRAAFVNMRTYIRKYGADTIRKIIKRWAPPSDNNPTTNYINFVAGKTGIYPDMPISANDPQKLIPVVAAMSQFENGVPANPSDVQAGWNLVGKVDSIKRTSGIGLSTFVIIGIGIALYRNRKKLLE